MQASLFVVAASIILAGVVIGSSLFVLLYVVFDWIRERLR